VDVGGGHLRAFVIKYDSKGETLWTKLYYDIYQFYDVATDSSGNIILVSTFYLGPSNYYTLTMKCDQNGDTLWTSRCDNLQCDAVATDLSDNVIVTGNKTVKFKGNSGVEGDTDHSFPTVFSLSQNYPNPFNSATLIHYTLSAVRGGPSAVALRVYNILGEEVITLVDRIQDTGRYMVVWDGKDGGAKEVGSGIYSYQLKVHTQKGGAYQKTRKLVLLR